RGARRGCWLTGLSSAGGGESRARWVGPKKSLPADRLLLSYLFAPSPSSSLTPPLVARSATRWPPAEAPQAPNRSGSRWYFFALARRNRTAAFTSWIWAGNTSCLLSR